MFLSRYRRVVDSLAPRLGRSYRLLRDSTNRRRSIETAYGFTLAGDPSMTEEQWEAVEIEAFLDLIASHDAIFDIGANVGFYSCLAASRGKQTLAFEPSPRNLRFLYRNLCENRFFGVEVFPLGLARQPGLGHIFGYGGIASFVPGWAQARAAQSAPAPLTTLDAVAAHRFLGKRLLIKVDVEGFELEVLAGAQVTLDLNPRPTWLVEILFRDDVIPGGVSHTFSETFNVFWERGYRCRKLDNALTPVEQHDVGQWVSQGFVEGETHNFLFEAD
jgi:FkbM family methyltransferase